MTTHENKKVKEKVFIDVIAQITAHQITYKMRDDMLAAKMRVCKASWTRKKSKPETITLGDIANLKANGVDIKL